MDPSSAHATMQPLEYPKWEDWPAEPLGEVRYGHLVLLRIDTQASVAALGDEVASREAALLPQEWFLGVIMANGLDNAVHPDGSGSDMLNFRFTLVGTGLPEPAHASYPFAPAAQTAEGRPPLVTSSPLPWPDLYAHTYFGCSVVISRVHRSPFSLASRLDADQLRALNVAVIADIYDRDNLPESEGGSAPPAVYERAESYDSLEFNELDDVELDEDMERKRWGARLYVELSFDPAVCPGLPSDPARYDELTARVEHIWDDWEERMLREVAARRPRQTAEWVQSLADDSACEEPSYNDAVSVLESPVYHDWPIPPLGPERYVHLVWLRLDPLASVSLLDDEIATRAAALLPRDWYLGFILGDARDMQYNPAGQMLLSLDFALLGDGPSDIEAHSIPIAPTPPYSDECPPVELASSLPWPNLYVYTHVNAGGIVCRIHHGTGRFEPVLPEDVRNRVYRSYFADTLTGQNAQTAASHPDEVYATDDDSSEGRSNGTEGGTNPEDSLEFDTRPIDEKYDRVHANVEVWLDPASYPGPPAHPDTWSATVKRLRGICDEWRERQYTAAKTRGSPEPGAWLQGVDAPVQLPHDDHDAALEPPLDDDAILPEDAVDHRIERGFDARSVSDGSSLAFYDTSNLPKFKFNISGPGQPATEFGSRTHHRSSGCRRR